jgi:hypothetical protein
MTPVAIAPDERALAEDLRGASFQAGAEADHWRLISVDWPVALVAVSAAPRPNAPTEFIVRFDLTGYPHAAPTGGLWDVSAGNFMGASGRPRGERAGQIFRHDWEKGQAMYAPWDRVALQGHGDWSRQYPRSAWHAQRDLAFVLANVFEVLNADDYLGI